MVEPLLARLPSAASLSPAEHARLRTVVDDIVTLIERHRRVLMATTSGIEYGWTLRTAVVARQAEEQFHVALDGPAGTILPGDWQAAEARDRAMADNVRWALAQEGPAGRVLVFAHNAHVKHAPTEGGIWKAFARAPQAMGMFLRSALGEDLVVI